MHRRVQTGHALLAKHSRKYSLKKKICINFCGTLLFVLRAHDRSNPPAPDTRENEKMHDRTFPLTLTTKHEDERRRRLGDAVRARVVVQKRCQ